MTANFDAIIIGARTSKTKPARFVVFVKDKGVPILVPAN